MKFLIAVHNGNNGVDFEVVDGKIIDEEYAAYKGSKHWSVTDVNSGMSVCYGKTLKEAKENFEKLPFEAITRIKNGKKYSDMVQKCKEAGKLLLK